jgi:hypothetical protein
MKEADAVYSSRPTPLPRAATGAPEAEPSLDEADDVDAPNAEPASIVRQVAARFAYKAVLAGRAIEQKAHVRIGILALEVIDDKRLKVLRETCADEQRVQASVFHRCTWNS